MNIELKIRRQTPSTWLGKKSSKLPNTPAKPPNLSPNQDSYPDQPLNFQEQQKNDKPHNNSFSKLYSSEPSFLYRRPQASLSPYKKPSYAVESSNKNSFLDTSVLPVTDRNLTEIRNLRQRHYFRVLLLYIAITVFIDFIVIKSIKHIGISGSAERPSAIYLSLMKGGLLYLNNQLSYQSNIYQLSYGWVVLKILKSSPGCWLNITFQIIFFGNFISGLQSWMFNEMSSSEGLFLNLGASLCTLIFIYLGILDPSDRRFYLIKNRRLTERIQKCLSIFSSISFLVIFYSILLFLILSLMSLFGSAERRRGMTEILNLNFHLKAIFPYLYALISYKLAHDLANNLNIRSKSEKILTGKGPEAIFSLINDISAEPTTDDLTVISIERELLEGLLKDLEPVKMNYLEIQEKPENNVQAVIFWRTLFSSFSRSIKRNYSLLRPKGGLSGFGKGKGLLEKGLGFRERVLGDVPLSLSLSRLLPRSSNLMVIFQLIKEIFINENELKSLFNTLDEVQELRYEIEELRVTILELLKKKGVWNYLEFAIDKLCLIKWNCEDILRIIDHGNLMINTRKSLIN